MFYRGMIRMFDQYDSIRIYDWNVGLEYLIYWNIRLLLDFGFSDFIRFCGFYFKLYFQGKL